MNIGLKTYQINKYWTDKSAITDIADVLPIESPLQIRVFDYQEKIFKDLNITMRTPGHDKELVVGFFMAEGIITQFSDIEHIVQITDDEVAVKLNATIDLTHRLNKKRHFTTSSSCGVCGDINLNKNIVIDIHDIVHLQPLQIKKKLVFELSAKSIVVQELFKYTGGIHASTLFSEEGHIIAIREDVGRHNALDKVTGYALINNLTPLHRCILLLSGRVSYELIQKAAVAGIKCICALGAPSSLAVDTAIWSGVTLIGFVTSQKFNVYAKSEYVELLD